MLLELNRMVVVFINTVALAILLILAGVGLTGSLDAERPTTIAFGFSNLFAAIVPFANVLFAFGILKNIRRSQSLIYIGNVGFLVVGARYMMANTMNFLEAEVVMSLRAFAITNIVAIAVIAHCGRSSEEGVSPGL